MENSESFIESSENNQIIVNPPIINYINVNQIIQEIEPIQDILMESLNDSSDSSSSNSIELVAAPITEPSTEPPTEPPTEPTTELSLEDKEKELIQILRENEYSYDIPESRDLILIKLYDLFKNHIIDETCNDHDYLTYLGFYYGQFKNDLKTQLEYYKRAIDGGNVHAMYNLGLHYQNLNKYNISKKYFDFLGKRTKLDNKDRYNIIFKY